jgi:hypothetical protein
MFMKMTWSTVDYLSTVDTNLWLDQVFATLAPGQPWKQNNIEISRGWLYQNTGLALTQFL